MSGSTACPTCQKPAAAFSESYFPFCSERCKMVDLGKWFGEEYRIESPLRPDHFEEFAELDLDEERRADGMS